MDRSLHVMPYKLSHGKPGRSSRDVVGIRHFQQNAIFNSMAPCMTWLCVIVGGYGCILIVYCSSEGLPVSAENNCHVASFPKILTSDGTFYQQFCETCYQRQIAVIRLEEANSVKIHLKASRVLAISVRCFHQQIFCVETSHQVLKS